MAKRVCDVENTTFHFKASKGDVVEFGRICDARGISMSSGLRGLLNEGIRRWQAESSVACSGKTPAGGGASMVSIGGLPAGLADEGSAGRRLDELLDKGLIEALINNPAALGQLDGKTLAQLAVQRAPKAKNADDGLNEQYLSLMRVLGEVKDCDVASLRDELRRSNQKREQLEKEVTAARARESVLLRDVPGEMRTAFKKACYEWQVMTWEHVLNGHVRGLTADLDAEKRGGGAAAIEESDVFALPRFSFNGIELRDGEETLLELAQAGYGPLAKADAKRNREKQAEIIWTRREINQLAKKKPWLVSEVTYEGEGEDDEELARLEALAVVAGNDVDLDAEPELESEDGETEKE